MRLIICVIECLEYDYLMKCNAPNIKSLNPHPSWSFGRTTRASVPAILGGLIPECIYRDCIHNKIRKRLVNPFFLTDLKRKGIPTFLFIANGWAMEFLLFFMPSWLRDEMIKQNKHGFNDEWNVRKACELARKHDKFFIYLHMMSTHPSFFNGMDPDLPRREGFDNVRRRAVEYVDKLIKPVIDLDADIIITSDHHIQHDYWHPRVYDVFIATKGFRWVK